MFRMSVTSINQPRGGQSPSKVAQLSPAIAAFIEEVCNGENPLIPREKQTAFVGAVLDEVGRGTDPCKLRERFTDCLSDQVESYSHAA